MSLARALSLLQEVVVQAEHIIHSCNSVKDGENKDKASQRSLISQWEGLFRVIGMHALIPHTDFIPQLLELTQTPHELEQTESLLKVKDRTFFSLQKHFNLCITQAGIRLLGRKIVVTSTGAVGTAPAAVQPGDEIWALKGCPGVMLVRKEGDVSKLVGEVFLDFVEKALKPPWTPQRPMKPINEMIQKQKEQELILS